MFQLSQLFEIGNQKIAVGNTHPCAVYLTNTTLANFFTRGGMHFAILALDGVAL
jgi:hypothetical protein